MPRVVPPATRAEKSLARLGQGTQSEGPAAAHRGTRTPETPGGSRTVSRTVPGGAGMLPHRPRMHPALCATGRRRGHEALGCGVQRSSGGGTRTPDTRIMIPLL